MSVVWRRTAWLDTDWTPKTATSRPYELVKRLMIRFMLVSTALSSGSRLWSKMRVAFGLVASTYWLDTPNRVTLVVWAATRRKSPASWDTYATS